MASQKLVIKCGNVAVLVDLHALPLGAGEDDTSWLAAEHVQEVALLVQEAVEQRVKQHAESLRSRRQAKHRKETPPAATFSATGTCFNLVANFLKRHFTLRCVVKDRYGELRVFPERCVVCVSRPEGASPCRGNRSRVATEWGEQSRSEYFSRVGVTQEPLNSSAKTKRNALQKIARQVRGETRDPGVGGCGTVHTGDDAGGPGGGGPGVGGHAGALENPEPGERPAAVERPGLGGPPGVGEHPGPARPESPPREESSGPAGPGTETGVPERPHLAAPVDLQVQAEDESGGVPPQERGAGHRRAAGSQLKPAQKTRGSKRAKACGGGGAAGEPLAPNAKRTCRGGSPAASPQPAPAVAGSSQTSNRDRLPPPLLPPPSPPSPLPPPPPPLPLPLPLPAPVEAEAASTASPVSARGETTAGLLTAGRRASGLPLSGSGTERANQNRLAASLRGLSVRPAGPGPAIGSRPALGGEGGQGNVPRTSRLRRLKRS